jgi:aminopeptidase N
MTDAERGYDEMFRAHEVAHQWWGISIEPATYRDRWLSEGFAEFSGLWYAARARASLPIYLKRLEETRREILERRDEAPPIALGTRASWTKYPGDYTTTIYHKGAWVLHMLRVMLTDPETGSDQLFTDIMKTFYTRHRGGKAATRSFQQVAEEVVGVDLGWFFDQWVYRSAIPTYTFSSSLVDQPDGTVRASIRIRQENVPDDFKMVVPIELDFGDQGSATVQVLVEGPLTEQELPPLPMRPRSITFNPYESVLAETRTEGWRN